MASQGILVARVGPWLAMRHFASISLALGLLLARENPAFAEPADSPDVLFERGGDLALRTSFHEAAACWEKFAEVAKADPRAPRALLDALRLRIDLDQPAFAKVDLDVLGQTFGEKNPEVWAEGVFALSAHFDRRGDRRAARALLGALIAEMTRRPRVAVPVAPAIVETRAEIELRARVRLARVLAAEGDARGAAAEYARVRANGPKLGVWPVKGKIARAARSEDTLDAIAEAFFMAAEEKRAEAERIELEPYRGKGDQKSVFAYLDGPAAKWIEKRRAAVEEAERVYVRVFGVEWPKQPPPPPPGVWAGDPNAPWATEDPTSSEYEGPPFPSVRFAIAAARRIGAAHAQVAHAIGTMPVPSPWSPVPSVPELRISVTNYYEGPSEFMGYRAKQAFATCLRLGVHNHIANEHMRACEEWLSKNYGAEYHLTEEFFRPPTWQSVGTTPEPVILALLKP